MKDLHVIVVGAGIGGLTAALALQKAGIGVSVFEQSASLGEVGAGVTITPNGCHALYHLLGEDVVNAVGRVPAAGAIKHYKTGDTLVETNRGNRLREAYGAPYLQAHRADLHGALASAVRAGDAGAIRLGCRFGECAQTPDGVSVRFDNGATASGDLLIGCDGIRSAVRQALWGPEDVSFTGYIAWRGLVPMDRLDPELVVPDSVAFAGTARTFTRYKVRGGRLVNYVAFSKRDEWTEEGWSVPAEVSDVQREFADFCPEVQAILAATPGGQCFKWGLFDRQPLPQWTRGRATLLGDAAHPMTPFLAQGAVMAIEDGLVLARALLAAASWQEGLARYEAARRERTTLVMRESHVNARRMYTRDPDQYTGSSHRNAESLGLYAYNPVTVPV